MRCKHIQFFYKFNGQAECFAFAVVAFADLKHMYAPLFEEYAFLLAVNIGPNCIAKKLHKAFHYVIVILKYYKGVLVYEKGFVYVSVFGFTCMFGKKCSCAGN